MMEDPSLCPEIVELFNSGRFGCAPPCLAYVAAPRRLKLTALHTCFLGPLSEDKLGKTLIAKSDGGGRDHLLGYTGMWSQPVGTLGGTSVE